MCVAGVGESSDAHHISSPDPQGVGGELALRAALADARIDAPAIGYVNLHATATRKNDEMEAHLMARVFPDGVAASGTKPLTGHQLGAAGATELGFAWLTLAARGRGVAAAPVGRRGGPRAAATRSRRVGALSAAAAGAQLRDEQFVRFRRQQCQPDSRRDDHDDANRYSRQPFPPFAPIEAILPHRGTMLLLDARQRAQRGVTSRSCHRAARRLVRRCRRRDAGVDRHRTDGAGHRRPCRAAARCAAGGRRVPACCSVRAL